MPDDPQTPAVVPEAQLLADIDARIRQEQADGSLSADDYAVLVSVAGEHLQDGVPKDTIDAARDFVDDVRGMQEDTIDAARDMQDRHPGARPEDVPVAESAAVFEGAVGRMIDVDYGAKELDLQVRQDYLDIARDVVDARAGQAGADEIAIAATRDRIDALQASLDAEREALGESRAAAHDQWHEGVAELQDFASQEPAGEVIEAEGWEDEVRDDTGTGEA